MSDNLLSLFAAEEAADDLARVHSALLRHGEVELGALVLGWRMKLRGQP